MRNFTTNQNLSVAGLNPALPENIEFVPSGKGMNVLCLQGGRSYPFKEIAPPIFTNILNKYMSDKGAKRFIQSLRKEDGQPYTKVQQVEIYTFFMWGGVDGEPDVIGGELQPSENFITGEDCPSLHFCHKVIQVDGNVINLRDIKIILMASNDVPNKAIASELKISVRTLEYHLTRLYRKVEAFTRTGLVAAAYHNQIIA